MTKRKKDATRIAPSARDMAEFKKLINTREERQIYFIPIILGVSYIPHFSERKFHQRSTLVKLLFLLLFITYIMLAVVAFAWLGMQMAKQSNFGRDELILFVLLGYFATVTWYYSKTTYRILLRLRS